MPVAVNRVTSVKVTALAAPAIPKTKTIENKTILMLFGGESPEHEVSLASAKNIAMAINELDYRIEYCFIDKTGNWWLAPHVTNDKNKLHGRLLPRLGNGTFVVEQSERSFKPDVILPVLHGPNGEDGSVQGLAQLVHIPIVGCDMAASAVCMNKLLAKRLLHEAGIPIVDYVVHRLGDEKVTYEAVSTKLGEELFVKPVSMGSSVGVTKVKTALQFVPAVQEALKYDNVVLIERAIHAREIEVAVIGGNIQKVSTPGEIMSDREFYDYASKYDAGSTSVAKIPAELDAVTREQIRGMAVKAYKSLGCTGLARIDFFLEGDDLYINEINTIPGFTDISMFPKLFMHDGYSYAELLRELIESAE